MKTALFINGVYESVLKDILEAQEKRGGGVSFLQPYKRALIRMLKINPPNPKTPTRLFLSVTHSLKNISYVADIVGWDDKRTLTEKRRIEVLAHLRNWQEGEVSLFTGGSKVGDIAVNLLTISELSRCESLPSTSILRKKSDNQPLKPRTRSGGWSEVYDDIGDAVFVKAEPKERVNKELEQEIAASRNSTHANRQARLSMAPRLPEKIQILSTAFRRNPDVIVEVLRRANGTCEHCKQAAPFIRKSNGSPFLEVHHWKTLNDGGEDTVENAGALCPNCHRQMHFG